jgi:multiple sugar transport system substrate-binding protein
MQDKLLKSVRTLVATLFVLMAGLAVSTASAQTDASGDITFIFWDYDQSARGNWEGLMQRFNEEFPDINVNLVGVPGANWAEYLERTATQIAGGERPDVIWVATEGVRFLADLGLLTPLNDRIERDREELEGLYSDVAPALFETFEIDGNQYLFPYSWNSMYIYYNTARFEEAGLEPPSPDWTWDDFVEAARALTVDEDNDGNPEQYGFLLDSGAMFFLQPWLLTNDASILDDSLCQATLTDPKVAESLQFLHDLIYTHKVTPIPSPGVNATEMLVNGNVAMIGAGRWIVQAMLQQGFTDFDIQYWPQNTANTSVFGVDGFPLFTMSQNPEAAWEFIKYMTRPEVQEGLLGGGQGAGTNIPARRSVASQIDVPDNASIYYDVLDRGVEAVTAPSNFNQMQNIFLRYADLIFANEMSVEDALQAAQLEMEGAIQCR